MRAIITFHSIDSEDSVLSYPPALFARLLTALDRCDLPVCSLNTLLDKATTRGVALTFDDGMKSVARNALPVLRDHAAPAHLFLTTAAVGQDNRWPTQPDDAPCYEMLDWDEIEQLHTAGTLIESHTHTHPDLCQLSAEEIENECEAADNIIEQRLGRKPRYFAYPYGYYDEAAVSTVSRRYSAAVTTRLHCLGAGDDLATLPRLDSYYLRNPWLIDHLDSAMGRLYLQARSLMRTLRGSQ